jgi:hypothetical protein
MKKLLFTFSLLLIFSCSSDRLDDDISNNTDSGSGNVSFTYKGKNYEFNDKKNDRLNFYSYFLDPFKNDNVLILSSQGVNSETDYSNNYYLVVVESSTNNYIGTLSLNAITDMNKAIILKDINVIYSFNGNLINATFDGYDEFGNKINGKFINVNTF